MWTSPSFEILHWAVFSGCDHFVGQSKLCHLSVCNDSQSVHLHLLLSQQLFDSFSPFTGLNTVCFFSVWKETATSF